MRLLITGANGFLGRRVVAAALGAGHAVRALVRPATDVGPLGWPADVDVFRADLRGGRELQDAFDGVDAVVHLAAGVTGTEEQQFQSTVAGTERLLDAMAESVTRRIVLASSFYVYDWRRARRELNESSPLVENPYVRDGYTIAKVWQERVVRRMAAAHGWELTVLRPGFIWGAGNPLPARVGVEVGRFFAVVGPSSDAALTHVDNCADFFVRAAETDVTRGETINVFDGHDVSAWQFAGTYARLQSPRLRRIPIPYRAGAVTAACAKTVSRLLYGPQGKLPSLLAPLLYQARFRPLPFPNTKLVRLLGEPRWTFEECVQRTFDFDETTAVDPIIDQSPTPQPADLHQELVCSDA